MIDVARFPISRKVSVRLEPTMEFRGLASEILVHRHYGSEYWRIEITGYGELVQHKLPIDEWPGPTVLG